MPKWLFITLLIALPLLFGAIHPILFFLALAGGADREPAHLEVPEEQVLQR